MADITTGGALLFGIKTPMSLVAAPVSGRSATCLRSGLPGSTAESFSASFVPAFNGNYKLVGTTRKNGAAYAALVMLSPSASPGLVLRGVWTGVPGTFEFRNLTAGTYLIEAVDQTGVANAVIYARVVAVPQ